MSSISGENGSSSIGKRPQKRRKHSNSKYGCNECKKRRVKCDQNLPRCRNCSTYRAKQLRCSYLDLTDEQMRIIKEANEKFDQEVKKPEVNTPISIESNTNNIPSSLSVTPSSSSITSSSNENHKMLPGGNFTNKKFKLNKFTMVNNEELINKTMTFISRNLELPIVHQSNVRKIAFVWDHWVISTIKYGCGKNSSTFYSLITWASTYLSTCIHSSVSGNIKSQLAQDDQLKPLQGISLTNKGVTLKLLTSALNQNQYSLLIDLMSSNIFTSGSNYGDEGYTDRMAHLNGLVAILYELYKQKKPMYVSGTDGYTGLVQNYNVFNNEDYQIIDNLTSSSNSSSSLSSPESSKNLAPGYTYFNNFTASELMLIKFFEWQIYLSLVAIFFPPYDYRCLIEFGENFMEFFEALKKINNNILNHYAENMIKYLRFLSKNIFPMLNANKESVENNLFELHPKIYYAIYMKYLLINPPESFTSMKKNSSLSIIERILYRYYINLGKLLDHIFPQVKYLFVLGFSTAFIQYSDEAYVLNAGIDELLETGKCENLIPKNTKNYDDLIGDLSFQNKLIYHSHYCGRILGFFRARNLLLHQGVFFVDPFTKEIKQNKLGSRKVLIEETQIVSFDRTFIKPENLPHNSSTNFYSKNLAGNAEFHGINLDKLTNSDPFYLKFQNEKKNVPIYLTPKEMLKNKNFKKNIDGNLKGYDFSFKALDIKIVLRHLVGKSLKEFFEDRAYLFDHYNYD